MTKIRSLSSALALSLALGGLAACNPGEDETPPPAAGAETPPDAMAAGEGATPAAGTVMVGGAPMLPTRTIPQNAAESADHSTLVSLVTAAGLGETLSGAGPFTVFAPTNAAFEKIPAATRTSLQQPAQKQALSGILTYHVVPGRVTAADLTKQITDGGGSASLTTVNGAKLTARAGGPGGVTLTDAAGNTSNVTQADSPNSNGIVHVIDTVLMPTRAEG